MRRAAPKGVAGAAVAAQTTFAILTPTLNAGGKSARDRCKEYAELAEYEFFFAALGQTAAWARLVGRHRSQKRC